MANLSLVSGPFNAVYIGSAAATGTPLTKLSMVDTGDYSIRYRLPRGRFVKAINGYPPSDNAHIDINLAFLSDNADSIRIAMGNLLSVTNQDAPPGGVTYSLFLYDAIHTDSSIWIPYCQSITDLDLIRSKRNPTQIALDFQWDNRDNQVNLFYKRSNSALKALMAGQSPI